MIKSIEVENEERAKVTLLPGTKADYEDGDKVFIDLVDGLTIEGAETELESTEITENTEVVEGETKKEGNVKGINGNVYKIKTIRYDSFYLLGDFTKFTKYVRGGTAKKIKVPKKLDFAPYHEIMQTSDPKFEMNLLIHDFMKFGHAQILHLAYLALDQFESTHKRRPTVYNLEDAKSFVEIAQKIAGEGKFKEDKFVDFEDEESKTKAIALLYKFCLTSGGTFAPQCAYIGGIVAQELVKAITGKFMPINQLMYADSIDVLQADLFPANLPTLTQEEYSKLLG